MKTIAQQLNIKEFPFEIKDSNGNEIYYEDPDGFWEKREFDSNGNEIYYEDPDGFWKKREYDSNGKQIYYENSCGFWEKIEFDSKGKAIYLENSKGVVYDNRPKPVVELTMEELSQILGYEVKIKK
jgi:hypothetical protein